MIDEAIYEQLDRYFHSAMNEQEKSAFESKMKTDKELREELDWLNNMLGGMKSRGRSVMKQMIANAISGIPSGEVAKYRPSVNGKSFLKKYWVAITVAVVAVSVAIAVYAYMTRHVNPPHEGEDNAMDVVPVKDSSLDSCMDVMSARPSEGANADSFTMKDETDSNQARTEDVIVKMSHVTKPVVYYGVDSPGKTQPTITGGYGWQGEQQQQVAMKTTMIQGQPPYTYELTDKLILKSNYTTTAGFVFTGKGDTFYMTDNSKQLFMLLKGRGELPLTPMKPSMK